MNTNERNQPKTEMKYDNMTVGARFYYTGDAANIDGEGAISKVIDSPKWGLSYNLTFDDGRSFRGVSPLSFEVGPGRRFWPLDEWQAHRAERIAEMEARYRKEVTMKTETYVLIVEVSVDELERTGDPRATIEAAVRNGAFFYAELPGDLPGKINAHSEKSSNLDEADVVSEIVEEWFTGDN